MDYAQLFGYADDPSFDLEAFLLSEPGCSDDADD